FISVDCGIVRGLIYIDNEEAKEMHQSWLDSRLICSEIDASMIRLLEEAFLPLLYNSGGKCSMLAETMFYVPTKNRANPCIGSATTVSGVGFDDGEVQRTMLELLNQLNGFEASNKIKVHINFHLSTNFDMNRYDVEAISSSTLPVGGPVRTIIGRFDFRLQREARSLESSKLLGDLSRGEEQEIHGWFGIGLFVQRKNSNARWMFGVVAMNEGQRALLVAALKDFGIKCNSGNGGQASCNVQLQDHEDGINTRSRLCRIRYLCFDGLVSNSLCRFPKERPPIEGVNGLAIIGLILVIPEEHCCTVTENVEKPSFVQHFFALLARARLGLEIAEFTICTIGHVAHGRSIIVKATSGVQWMWQIYIVGFAGTSILLKKHLSLLLAFVSFGVYACSGS
ncbi:hypothetical protein Tco_0702011, partial [Tanacetum coccineum]